MPRAWNSKAWHSKKYLGPSPPGSPHSKLLACSPSLVPLSFCTWAPVPSAATTYDVLYIKVWSFLASVGTAAGAGQRGGFQHRLTKLGRLSTRGRTDHVAPHAVHGGGMNTGLGTQAHLRGGIAALDTML